MKLEVPETVEASIEARCVTVASFLFTEVVQLHIRVTHLTRIFLLPRCRIWEVQLGKVSIRQRTFNHRRYSIPPVPSNNADTWLWSVQLV